MEKLIIFKFTHAQLAKYQKSVDIKLSGGDTTIMESGIDRECAWCTSKIMGEPSYIYTDRGEKNKLGQFCNMEICKFAFDQTYFNNKYRDNIRINILREKKIFVTKIYPVSPPQLELIKFGGKKTLEEYRQTLQETEFILSVK